MNQPITELFKPENDTLPPMEEPTAQDLESEIREVELRNLFAHLAGRFNSYQLIDQEFEFKEAKIRLARVAGLDRCEVVLEDLLAEFATRLRPLIENCNE